MNLSLRLAVTGTMLVVTLPVARAQIRYPAQPVRVIVTTAPGAGLDAFARLVTRELSTRGGQQFIADNRPGAGTTMGAAIVARAKPDGYTLLINTAAFTITPAVYRSRETTSILRTPDVKQRLAAEGVEVVGSSPAEFGFVHADIVKWTKLVKAAGIPPM
jgi:tripartite-type tricarboxylate transporter receptor subunit TctC